MIKGHFSGFRENHYEMKIKYDGERTINKYTVLLIPLLERSRLKCSDTDCFAEDLDAFIKETSIDVDSSVRKSLTGIFEKLTGIMIDKYGDDVVFALSIIQSYSLKFYAYLIHGGASKYI